MNIEGNIKEDAIPIKKILPADIETNIRPVVSFLSLDDFETSFMNLFRKLKHI